MFHLNGRFLLMLGALIAVGLSWVYWSYTGNDGAVILGAAMLLILIIENNILRARVQKLERQQRTE